jgi:hypothetical protein
MKSSNERTILDVGHCLPGLGKHEQWHYELIDLAGGGQIYATRWFNWLSTLTTNSGGSSDIRFLSRIGTEEANIYGLSGFVAYQRVCFLQM